MQKFKGELRFTLPGTGTMIGTLHDESGEPCSQVMLYPANEGSAKDFNDMFRMSYRMWRNSHPDGHLWPLPEHVIPPVEG